MSESCRVGADALPRLLRRRRLAIPAASAASRAAVADARRSSVDERARRPLVGSSGDHPPPVRRDSGLSEFDAPSSPPPPPAPPQPPRQPCTRPTCLKRRSISRRSSVISGRPPRARPSPPPRTVAPTRRCAPHLSPESVSLSAQSPAFNPSSSSSSSSPPPPRRPCRRRNRPDRRATRSARGFADVTVFVFRHVEDDRRR